MNSRRRRTLALWSLFGLLLVSASANAEPFETIINNGSPQNRLDIAVLGDGYTVGELQKYQNDVATFMQGFFAQEPFKEYQHYFNVHRIDVTSNQSGADHPESGASVNTALDATYNCAGIQRLICVNQTKVDNVLNNTLAPAQHDITLVIVNDAVYGGSGGAVAVASTHASAVELILHEEGHSLGLLGDEYGGPPPPSCNSAEPFSANITAQTQRSMIKWTSWIDAATPVPTTSTTAGVPGLYQGAGYCDSTLYRPTFNSKMRSLGFPYEQVNSEQLIKRIYNFVSPLDSSTPASGNLSLVRGQTQAFMAATPSPFSHNLSVTWVLDGQAQTADPTFNLDTQALSLGSHSVVVSVSDPTTAVRNDPDHVLLTIRIWNVQVNAAAAATPIVLSATNYNVAEGGASATVTVTRGGDLSGASTVEFMTSDGSAKQSEDYVVANGTLSFAAGEASKTFAVLIVDDGYVEANETLNVTLTNAVGATIDAPDTATITVADNDTGGTISPAHKRFATTLDGFQVLVQSFSPAKGIGLVLLNQSETAALAGLSFHDFNNTETAASIRNQAAPATVMFPLPLSNPVTNFAISPSAPQVADLKAESDFMIVNSNAFPDGEISGRLLWNPSLEEKFFVRQQYLDFLSRDGDPGGFDFWVGTITPCQAATQCFHDKTIAAADAFFFEPEFQQTAGFVFRAYRAAYGNNQPFPNPDGSNAAEANKLVDYPAFVADRARVVGGANLTAAQQAFANLFVRRPAFVTRYAGRDSSAQFVSAILTTIQDADGANLSGQQPTLMTEFDNAGGGDNGRARVLYLLANDNAANQAFIDAEYNRQFALTLYFGYLRRNPDIGGFLFWQSQINLAAVRDVPKQNALVCSFITAAEYQFRFGMSAPRTNTECPQ